MFLCEWVIQWEVRATHVAWFRSDPESLVEGWKDRPDRRTWTAGKESVDRVPLLLTHPRFVRRHHVHNFFNRWAFECPGFQHLDTVTHLLCVLGLDRSEWRVSEGIVDGKVLKGDWTWLDRWDWL